MPISFVNPGEADLRALLTMGLNAKESENPIGYFGTGFKYGLATALRLGCKVHLHVGTHKHEFTTRTETVRGQEFDFIYIDGEPLHITTALGRTWEAWKAYREFYCNALDEGGETVVGWAQPRKDWTTLTVVGDPFEKVYNDRDLYFIDKKKSPMHSYDGVEIYDLPTPGRFFYKGIYIGQFSRSGEALWSYNFLTHIDLSEDREVRSESDLGYRLGDVLVTLTNPTHIERFLRAKASMEHTRGVYSSYDDWSDEFMEFVSNWMRTQPMLVPDVIASNWRRKTNFVEEIETFELSPVQQQMYARAKTIVEELGESVEFPVQFAVSLGAGALGLARHRPKDIYIAQEAFALGTKVVASTLYEEVIHLRYGIADNTRQMQEKLLNKIFDLYEVIDGKPI